MLPFLKHSQDASVSMPSDTITRKPDEEKEYDVFEACAEDLINAIHSKDVKGVAEALKAAFELADSEPHYEGQE